MKISEKNLLSFVIFNKAVDLKAEKYQTGSKGLKNEDLNKSINLLKSLIVQDISSNLKRLK